MKIEPRKVTVRELTEGYEDNDEQGVVGYGGKLDIRPPYQREFIYDEKKRNAVIDTLRKGFPLNVMYWAVRKDGKFEVIDGQQRTISICRYVHGVFSVESLFFHNLRDDQQAQILDYELMVYFCEGTDTERLDWFRTINIAGVRLEEQELRNAVYAGPWTAHAKRYFSKTNCPAYELASDYVTGIPNRQDYLETAIEWHADATKVASIEDYMATHQHDANAVELWNYFQSVINWVTATFTVKRREIMRQVKWGLLYNAFGSKPRDPAKLERRIAELIEDEDVQRKAGIYPYLLDGDERHLGIRAFSDKMKREAYERQKGVCPKCKKKFEFEGMEGDHITPWREKGKTVADNCQMLCKDDNRRKGGR